MQRIKCSACLLQAIMILAMLLALNPARAAGLAGHIIMVKGDVTAQAADGSSRNLKRRDEVYPSDTIRTGNGSRVQIRFIDNALLALQENSQLSIHAYQQQNADGSGGKVLMELVEGGFRTLTGSIGKGNKEAYKVDTPVASIGIRGTLYSVMLAKGQLLAGVWKGGISLSSGQGSFNLGQDADFNFGMLGAQGFQGMLAVPQELDSSPEISAGELSSAGSGHPQDDLTPPADTVFAGYPLNTSMLDNAVPNPFDQDAGSGSEEALNDGGNLIKNSPDLRLTPEEFNAYKASTTLGSMIVNGKAVAVSAFRDDRGELVFVSIDSNNSTDITRYSGITDSTQLPSELTGLAGVEWGIWNGAADLPVSQQLDENSLTVTPVISPVMWVVAEPALQSNIPTDGIVSFSGTQALGVDSDGNKLLYADGSFRLDFASGDITSGFLNASYEDGSGQSIGGNFWSADFTGSIRASGSNQNGALAEMKFGSGFHGEGGPELDTIASSFNGILVAPSGEVFTGSFNLVDTNGNSAAGIVAWPQVPDTGQF
ncbi:FecR family protein [Thalassolituus hydrocarboniclasticus]|uniref:FecR domain-containing protein n=1 Tax=Thalassolituus hydrocarboniclasticus TaxID=2742796 RepID=A0ABY6A7K7_9GAMM|nr:FecR family protein [Thalassolituus hydrocarboniclasticus]UXD86610.1 FecR domain-containing protein [Thalassolituus hydrocarboniclasticus]